MLNEKVGEVPELTGEPFPPELLLRLKHMILSHHGTLRVRRQYIGPDGRVLLPGNSARNAISEEFARAAILPGESRSEKPVFADRKGRSSNQNPVLIRGNRRKKRTTSGEA